MSSRWWSCSRSSMAVGSPVMVGLSRRIGTSSEATAASHSATVAGSSIRVSGTPRSVARSDRNEARKPGWSRVDVRRRRAHVASAGGGALGGTRGGGVEGGGGEGLGGGGEGGAQSKSHPSVIP